MAARRRWTFPVLLVAAGSMAAGANWVKENSGPRGWSDAPPSVQSVLWPEPVPLPELRLHDQHGAEFGVEQLTGGWSFMFFGYLGCPDVCPTTLYAMKGLRDLLAEQRPGTTAHRFIFVSVDPERDSPESMAEYLSFFDPEFIGVVGTAEELQRLTSTMAVMYLESADLSGVRSIDHTSSIMVLDPRGRVVASLPPPHDPVAMARRFTELQAYLRTR